MRRGSSRAGCHPSARGLARKRDRNRVAGRPLQSAEASSTNHALTTSALIGSTMRARRATACVHSRQRGLCMQGIVEPGCLPRGKSRGPYSVRFVSTTIVDVLGLYLARRSLRLAPTPRDSSSAKPVGFGVCQVKLTHTLPCIRKGDANRCSLAVRDFVTRLVADPNCLARHRCSPFRFWWGDSYHRVLRGTRAGEATATRGWGSTGCPVSRARRAHEATAGARSRELSTRDLRRHRGPL